MDDVKGAYAVQRNALTELVRQHVGTHGGGRWTVRDFAARAVDPDTGYHPSTGLVGKLIAGQRIMITPGLVSAIAAGLGVPREIVAAAAHWQLIGYDLTELEGGAPATLVHTLDTAEGETPKARAVAARWAAEGSVKG